MIYFVFYKNANETKGGKVEKTKKDCPLYDINL